MTEAQKQIIQRLDQILAAAGGGGGGATIAATSAVLKGDGAGNGIAATPGTDFATPAQAAHSGGVIGTATFESSGSVGAVITTGIISGVTYTSTGVYAVTFSPNQPDTGYIVIANSVGGDVHGVGVPSPSKNTTGFELTSIRASDGAPHDPTSIELVILRLSQ